MSATSVPVRPGVAAVAPGRLKVGQVDKGLGRAARLARGKGHVDLAVDLHVVEVGAAHERNHLARLRAHGDERAVGDVAVGQRGHLLRHDALGLGLQLGVERRRDVQAGMVERLGAKHLLELLAHKKRKVGRLEVVLHGLVDQRLGPGGVRLGLRDIALFHHQPQHHGLAFLGALGVGVGVVVGGQLRQAGQQRGLRQREVGGILAKEGLGGGVDPVGHAAVEDLVEIHLQDFVLAVAARDLGGENRLFDLACHRHLGREQHALDQLLGDSRAAGHDVALLDGVVDGARQGDRVHAGVAVEVGVLGGDGGVHHVLRHAVERHLDAPPGIGVKGFVEQVAFAVVDARALEGRGPCAQLAGRRQVAGDGGITDQRQGEPQCGKRDKGKDAGDKARPEAAAAALAPRCSGLPLRRTALGGALGRFFLNRLQFVHKLIRPLPGERILNNPGQRMPALNDKQRDGPRPQKTRRGQRPRQQHDQQQCRRQRRQAEQIPIALPAIIRIPDKGKEQVKPRSNNQERHDPRHPARLVIRPDPNPVARCAAGHLTRPFHLSFSAHAYVRNRTPTCRSRHAPTTN